MIKIVFFRVFRSLQTRKHVSSYPFCIKNGPPLKVVINGNLIENGDNIAGDVRVPDLGEDNGDK